jgi:hypothetical protein
MRILNKLVYACCSIAFGLMALPSCEGGELYDVNAPDWISEKVDSIANSKKDPEEEVLEGMQEDVYSFGNADYTSGFWTAFSKYYVVPDGQKWHGVFNLNINPADNTYYKNFALVITNDADRGGEGYTEYGAYRFDTTNDTLAYNSQWGSHLFFKYTSSTLMLSPVDNLDETVQKLGGKVTLTVDRTNENAFSIKIQNASATKTYKQPYKLPNLFHYFKRSIGHHRLVAILALEGLVVDDYQCLRAQFVHIGDGSELEFFCSYGLSHPFFEADDGSNPGHGFFE